MNKLQIQIDKAFFAFDVLWVRINRNRAVDDYPKWWNHCYSSIIYLGYATLKAENADINAALLYVGEAEKELNKAFKEKVPAVYLPDLKKVQIVMKGLK